MWIPVSDSRLLGCAVRQSPCRLPAVAKSSSALHASTMPREESLSQSDVSAHLRCARANQLNADCRTCNQPLFETCCTSKWVWGGQKQRPLCRLVMGSSPFGQPPLQHLPCHTQPSQRNGQGGFGHVICLQTAYAAAWLCQN